MYIYSLNKGSTTDQIILLKTICTQFMLTIIVQEKKYSSKL